MAAAFQERHEGAVIKKSTFRHPRLATASFDGRTILSADARGKHLLVRFDDGRTLHAHMLMQGRVTFRPAYDVPQWRRRFEFTLDSGVVTGIDVPKLDIIKTKDEERILAYLGPDLCGRYDHEKAVERLRSAGPAPLGGALLNQRLIAGFGNIYAVETPFICGITPFQPVDTIPDIHRVVAIGAALIRTNARLGPQRTTGQPRQRMEQWILPSARRRCLICGSRVERYSGKQSPWQRRLGVCPNCQKRRDPAPVDLDRVRSLLHAHPAFDTLDLDAGTLTVPTLEPVEVRGRYRTGPVAE